IKREISRKDMLINVGLWVIGMIIIFLIAYDPQSHINQHVFTTNFPFYFYNPLYQLNKEYTKII
ncbi:MAG: hypothetical protein P8Y18_00565, partial [Candidatus Bathyarchaeota archaeon]